ncbi:MAG: hypothetical protein A2096_09485 [Spirochaetes bacterium GWF1_41_5]|nr:MAG: hypothetical protein A2096_09485 [Spirochaetes bacterium GWF1_41_5]
MIDSVVLNKKVLSEEFLVKAKMIHKEFCDLDNIAANRFSIKEIFEDYFCSLYPELLKTSQDTGQLIVNSAIGLLRKINSSDSIDYNKVLQIQEAIRKSGSVIELINVLYLSSYLFLAPIENNSLNSNFITEQNMKRLRVGFNDYVKNFFKILDNYSLANELMGKNIEIISKNSEELNFKNNQIGFMQSNVVAAFNSFFGMHCGLKILTHYAKPPEGFPYLITQKEITQMQQFKKICKQDKYCKDIKVEMIFDIMFNIYVELKRTTAIGSLLKEVVFDLPKEQKEVLERQLSDAKIDFYERVVRPFVRRTSR